MNHHKCTLLRGSSSHLPKLLPSAAWHQKVYRKFKKLFLISSNHPEVYIYLKSNAAIEKESKRQVELAKCVIHPLSPFRQYWNLMIFFMMFLHQALTAFTVGFFVELDYNTIFGLIIVDYIICAILFLEIILSFRTGMIVKETNEIILEPLLIAKKYRVLVIFDVINMMPYIYLTTFIIDMQNTIVNGAVIVYMVAIMLFYCFYFNRMIFYFSSLPLIINLKEKSSIILQIFIRSIFLLHMAACVRRLVPLYVNHQDIDPHFDDFKDFGDPSKFAVSISSEEDIEDIESIEKFLITGLEDVFQNYTMIHMYTRSLLITLRSSIQAGYGYETSDSIMIMFMSTLIMIGGWVYAAYVKALIFNIIVASSISENKFEEMMREVEAFIDSKNLSATLRSRIHTFLKRKFHKHYFNEEAIKQSTPACLRKEIMMSKCSNLVGRVPLFKDIPQILLEKIISCLQFEIYFPDDVIIQANTLGDSMYFIAYGSASITSFGGKHLQTICDGSHFGEISLLIKGQKRTATVKALEICEIYKLSQRDFQKVIEPHREIVNRMEHIAHERIKSMLPSKQRKFSIPLRETQH